MAVKVPDSARGPMVSRGIAAPDGAVGTQRVFDDKVMDWLPDNVLLLRLRVLVASR